MSTIDIYFIADTKTASYLYYKNCAVQVTSNEVKAIDYVDLGGYVWKDHVIELGKGDIVMFPSLFLFPHGVTAATKGTRYSGVCWAW